MHGVLYSEKDLADRLGISRTPVREALIELAREGLVTIAPQRGFQLHSLSHAEQEEVYELRLAIDSFVVEKLAKSATPDDIKQLREAIAEQRAAGGETTTALVADEQFHLLFPKLLGPRADLRAGLDACAGRCGCLAPTPSGPRTAPRRCSTSTRRSSTRSRRTTPRQRSKR